MPGHIYRRTHKDGSPSRWYAVIDLPAVDGRRRQKTTSHDTKKAARDWLTKTAEELRVGDHYDTTITLGEYLVSWLVTKNSLRPSTRAEYDRHIRKHFLPVIGWIRLVDLRAHHLDALFRSLSAPRHGRPPVSAATQRRIFATLNSALNTAVKQGLIRRNPAITVELPSASRNRRRVWTTEEAAAFLTQTTQDPWHLLYRILLLVGLRRGEVVALQWRDLDTNTGALTIERTITLVEGSHHTGPPKTAAGHRTVHLDQGTVQLLLSRRRHEELALPPGQAMAERYIFSINVEGDCLSPAYVSRHFGVLTRQLGLPPIRLHDLRHTSASIALAAGEPLVQVSRRLGHSGIGVTADIYSHVTSDVAAKAADALANHLNPKENHA